MGTDDAWDKQARRLRELARNPAVAAYLLGRLCAESSTDELADLVEACLVYRERFVAPGNYRRATPAEVVSAHVYATESAWVRGLRHHLNEADLPDL